MTHIVIPDSNSVASLSFSKILTVDISDFTDPDYISLSLPEFPSSKLDLTQTFVDFTSHATGDFGIGPTDQISFDLADPTLPVSDGDTEMRIPISLLSTIDKSQITGVRFRIYAEEDCTFRCLAIRACSADWTYAPIDLDTLWDRVHFPPSTDGSADQIFNFPSTVKSGWPINFPILFRTDGSIGEKDPRPIDISIGAWISTGSLDEADGSDDQHFNEVAFYFRDVPTDDQIQVELNSLTQADLETLKVQPDFGTAAYTARTQKHLDLDRQSDLYGDSQFDIERLPDYTTHSWLEVKLKWCDTPSLNTLTVFNADGLGYMFTDIALDPINPNNLDEGQYILLIDLEDNWIQVKIYGMNQVGSIDRSNLVFDSGKIVDDILIKRRKGRFGWWTNFIDGDTFLNNVKTRGTNFGEIVTKELQSVTPVKGVSLYAGTTSDHELLTEIGPASWSTPVTISLDPGASTSGKAYKVTSSPQYPFQGILSNSFLIDDPEDIDISFNIKFPSASNNFPGGSLTAFLVGPYDQTIPLDLSAFKKDAWSRVRVKLANELFQTGYYRLALLQTKPVITTTWWLENLSVKTSSVKWAARSYAPGAWGSPDERWVPAGHTLNSLNGGIVFPEIGSGLQVRGQATKQDATISEFKAIPQYATLGRFVWDEEEPDDYAPTAFFTSSKDGLTVTATGVGFDPEGSVTSYLWDFGDGRNDSGLGVMHTYERAGTYTITLTVSDSFGNTAAYQSPITVP